MRWLLFLFLSLMPLLSESTIEKFPDYRSLFLEFDVEPSFIYNPHFEAFVQRHERGLRAFYARSLKRGHFVMPMIQSRLLKEGLSDLLVYQSMIESGFVLHIASPKKAVGLWQFMPLTAKRYHLEVNDLLDERCNPFSSTTAAIAYLRQLHKRFGKWYLAVMAFNCGEGRLSKAIAKAKSDALEVLIDPQARYLPKETREYIQKILLIALIGEHERQSFYRLTDFSMEVEVKGGTDLRYLAKLLKVKEALLLALNPDFPQGIVPQRETHYKIHIPKEGIIPFYLLYDVKQEKSEYEGLPPTKKRYLTAHEVALGETLASIAKAYHTTVIEIKRVNHLTQEALVLNQLLVIPVDKKFIEKMSPKPLENSKDKVK